MLSDSAWVSAQDGAAAPVPSSGNAGQVGSGQQVSCGGGMMRHRILVESLRWLRQPVGQRSGGGLAGWVYVGFVLIHLGLAQGMPVAVDIDELQYGDSAVAILDGYWDDLTWRRLRGREGFPLLFGPLVTPFFATLGASLFALRVAFITFSGIWAVAWVSVARHMAPYAPTWAVAGLFLLPAPFVSRYAISPMAMSTHLGVSAAHGVVLLLLLVAWRARGLYRWGGVFAAGLVGGFSIYGGLLFLALLPGVIVAAALVAGGRGVVVLLLGLLPGLAAALPLGQLVSLAGHGMGVGGIPLPPYLWDAASVQRPFAVLHYLPGYPPPQGWVGNYLPVGLAYFSLVGVAHLMGQRARAVCHAPMLLPLTVSAVSLLVACVWIRFTPYDLDPAMWDAPRYAVPLLPIAAVIVLRSCSRQVAAGQRGATTWVAILLLAHAVGLCSHLSWRERRQPSLSESWMRGHSTGFELQAFPLATLPDSERRRAYALHQGAVACAAASMVDGFPLFGYPIAMKPLRRGTLEATRGDVARAARLERWAPSAEADDPAWQEFWRGVGRCVFVARAMGSFDPPLPVNPSAEVEAALWHGIGIQAHQCDFDMEAMHCPPEAVTRNLPTTAVERRAYVQGWSRACVHTSHGPALLPPADLDRRLGRRLRWELDVALSSAPAVDDEALEQLSFVRWRP